MSVTTVDSQPPMDSIVTNVPDNQVLQALANSVIFPTTAGLIKQYDFNVDIIACYKLASSASNIFPNLEMLQV